jgi:ABC-type antimicrobial peptide transport system permease subunit
MNNHHEAKKYKEEIRNIAQSLQIKCYIYTLDELIDNEKQENKTLMSSLGTLVLFALFVALSGILASYLADVGSWQKEIAIMYLNGVAPRDVYLIILLENFIKALLGINVAVYTYGHTLSSYDYEIYWSMVVPVLILGTLICVIVFSYIAFKTIKQKDLLSIYGGAKL